MKKLFVRRVPGGAVAGLAAVLLVGVCSAFSATSALNAEQSDISGHWGEQTLQEWVDEGMLSGYGDGSYRPDAGITRAEFMALVNRVNAYADAGKGVDAYTDVKPSDWYCNDVAVAVEAGYVNGTGADTISPEQALTRQEAVAMILRSKGIAPSEDLSPLSATKDGGSAQEWAKGYLAAAIENGLIGGSDSNVSPRANITRAELVTLLDRIQSDVRTYAFAGEYGPSDGTLSIRGAVVSAPGAVLKNTSVNGDLEISPAVADGGVRLENTIVSGNLYIKGGGANTVVLNGVSVSGELVVSKDTGGEYVRVLATGKSEIQRTRLESGAYLIESGSLKGTGFTDVEITPSAGNALVVLDGDFVKVANAAEGLDFTLSGNIEELESNTDLIAGIAGGAASVTGSGAVTETPVASVDIVHVNDMHTYVGESDSSIGYAKIAGYYELIANENASTLFLDAGDCFFGTKNGVYDKAESLMPIVRSMGIHAMVTGNHEYTYGTEWLLHLTGMLDHPVLCANMVYKGGEEKPLDGYTVKTLANGAQIGEKDGQPFAGYVVKTLANGIKVGIIGLTTPVSASMGATDVSYIDAVAVAQYLVGELRPKVDLVIALCHIGDAKGDPMTTDMIANGVEGIDVIIDGHSHTRLSEGKMVNGVLVAQTGEYCNNIGMVKLIFKGKDFVSGKASLISKADVIDLDIPAKAETKALVDEFLEKSAPYFEKVVGYTAVELNGARNDIRTAETNAGSFYADVMTEAASVALAKELGDGVKVDAGLYKAGPIGGTPGPTDGKTVAPITLGNIADLARVDSLIIVKKASGADVLEFLNFSLETYPVQSGSFQQVSGITFTLDPKATEPAGKLSDVKIGGLPLDPGKDYYIATIMGSNDEPGLRNGELAAEAGYSSEILVEYLSANHATPETALNAGTDGRINIK
jgi:5'-nucleotidase